MPLRPNPASIYCIYIKMYDSSPLLSKPSDPGNTGCFRSSVTLLITPLALLYEVVESSSCVHSIPLVILHLIGIVYSPPKCIFCHNQPSIENPKKIVCAEFWQVHSRVPL
jgi:hypothetical protein